MEVKRRLGKISISSPRSDGVTYADLRRADPKCHSLRALYNTPETVLVYKKGDRREISNWRPLTLGLTTAKLFAALVADRLTKWATTNGRLSPAQKGFLQNEFYYERGFVLQEIIRDSNTKSRELSVA
ncbi:uncharacterized protein LOC106640502 [Copidosoma floridanum]|uniref:uncharacterized protein LOC106640502 n=1 Tax=Copidosoma floridanum TaxID=29053 RepID=UPI0006C94830|nr:uncharacterized protein LOC106640502 [Copidosoma floridanum]